METLQELIPRLTFSRLRRCRELTVVGLRAETLVTRIDPSTLDMSMARGDLVVDEMPRAARVGTVQAVNRGSRPVLVLAGEELLGARQNRIVNASVWVNPRRKARVPVSCVEQGRWSPTPDSAFRSASTMYFPSGLSAHTARVAEGYRRDGQARGDQSRVWSDVRTRLLQSGATSATSSMHTVYQAASHTALDEYATKLRGGAAECGFAVFHEGWLVGVELFYGPAFCAAVFNKYVRAYALDQALRGHGGGVRDLAELLERVRTIPVASFAAPSSGEDLRFDCARFHGSALVVADRSGERRVAHLSVFAAS